MDFHHNHDQHSLPYEQFIVQLTSSFIYVSFCYVLHTYYYCAFLFVTFLFSVNHLHVKHIAWLQLFHTVHIITHY